MKMEIKKAKRTSSGMESSSQSAGAAQLKLMSVIAAAALLITGIVLLFTPVREGWMLALLLFFGFLMNVLLGIRQRMVGKNTESAVFFFLCILAAAGALRMMIRS